ncbi:MAG: sugar ABC transporter ATP-binding protein [Enterocloster sp.]
MDREIVLSMQNICKSFGPVQVLENVDLQLGKGEVMGLIGENGAGKSTLIKILCGIYHADSGEIILNGKKVSIPTAQAAKDLGISTIYQELSIIPDLNAVQNIFLNRELAPGNSLFSKLKYSEMKEKARKVLEEELKVQMDLDIPLKYVPLAQKQMVEIARTVYANGQIVIMDEPTAALQAEERDKLFSVIRGLKEKGHSIIFISHHLDELMEICDFLTVLRDGHKVDEGPVGEFSVDRIISDMVGKELKNKYPKKDVPIGDVIMKVEGLSDGKAFSDVSFELHRGEILGIAGLEGCGKNEVIRAIFGKNQYNAGTIEINHKTYPNRIHSAMEQGIAFVPAERKVEGLFLKQDIAWNTTIASLKRICKMNTLSRKEEIKRTESYIQQLHTKANGPNQSVSALSGGNQQKVMLSRWIMTEADVFLLEEPTRGIDVGAKTEVYEAIGDCVKNQKGVVVVSSEEEEVLGICDRVIVMKNGRIAAILNAKTATTEEIKHYAV